MPRREVRTGAGLLDVAVPGWKEHINLHTLDLEDTCGCVLGQLEGKGLIPGDLGNRNPKNLSPYIRGAIRLGLGFDGRVKHGFAVDDLNGYPQLTKEWQAEIMGLTATPETTATETLTTV